MTEAFYDLLKASFHGSIVILAVLLLRQLLKKAPRSIFCLLWLLAGLRLMLPFEIESNLSLQPQIQKPELSIQVQQPMQVPDVQVQNPVGQPLDEPQQPNQPEGNREDVQTESYLYAVDDGAVRLITFGDIAAQVWILGMAAMLTASAISYIRLKRRVRMACLMENGCFECPGLETAFVLGFFPPKIYLPAGLTDSEKKFIFDHENTHIARHDHWFKLLGYLVLSLHWFNPLVWIGYSLLCRDIELACDEHVVKYMNLTQRKAYSAALLSCGGHTARIAACPVAFGESNPKKRILNVLNYKRPTFWISLLAVIAVIFVSVCLLTSPREEMPPAETDLVWNLEMKVKDPTPSGAQVIFEQSGLFQGCERATLQYGSYYTLEKWEEEAWVAVEPLPQEHEVGWTMEAYLIKMNSTNAFNVNWEWLYGQLPAGRYRIGKDVDLFRMAGDYDSEMFWAEFTIEETVAAQPAWSMDMTEEEFLAMCRDAVVELQCREQFHISETLIYYTGDNEDSRSDVTFWRDGENRLRESYVTRRNLNNDFLYYDGNLYRRMQEASAESEWKLVDGGGQSSCDPWLCLIQWDNQTVTFEAAEQKEDELLVAVIAEGAPPTLGWDDVQAYRILFFFDKAGRMSRVMMSACREDLSVLSALTIETTLAADIHNQMEVFAAQRPGAEQSQTEGQWLEKCRTALETYQTQGTWAIQAENTFWGLGPVNSSSMSQWFGNGNDFMIWTMIPDDFTEHVWWDLQVNGEAYHRRGGFPKDGSEGTVSQWEEGSTDSQTIYPHWPLWYKWVGADIQFVEQGTADSVDYVTVTVQGSPFPEHPENIEEYQVTFRFRNDVLHFIELTYQRSDSQGGGTRIYDLYAFAPKDVENKINQCHREALLHICGICNDPECTDASHDHSARDCTDTNCTDASHNHHHDHH